MYCQLIKYVNVKIYIADIFQKRKKKFFLKIRKTTALSMYHESPIEYILKFFLNKHM